jgi:polar amino acid transport system substrate-binding protein
MNIWHRRNVLKAGAAVSSLIVAGDKKVWAQPASKGQGMLAGLQAAKKVRVGLANQPPFSGLNPDGTVTGVVPAIASAVMTRLGVPGMEGTLAAYGQLIPGMQAGRWDFVAASLTINKGRCAQVKFSDPIAFDGGAIVSIKGDLPNPPKLVKDLVERKLVVGSQIGGANSRIALAAGVEQANLRQFPDDNAIIDGLVAKRIQVAFGTNTALKRAYSQRGLNLDVTFPIADSPPLGASCAFRTEDTDLYEAFQTELRDMKTSGQFAAIAQQFGFETPPELMNVTADELCTRVD